MSPTFCEILPSVHSLTGCDSTSSFLGIGKKSVSKLLKIKGSGRLEKLALMDGQYKDEVQTAAREFVVLLYDPSDKERKYNFCLYKLSSKLTLRKCNTAGKFPPCEDAFKQHVKRAMWQTKIWMSSHIGCPDIGSPFDFGWKKEGAVPTPILYEGLTKSE